MKAKLLKVLLLIAIIFSLVSCSTNDSVTPVAAVSTLKSVTYTYSASELETLNLINTYRVSVGLKTLEPISYISYKSEEHDNYMIANNVVNHNDFVARSEDIMKVIGAKTVSENIAYNFITPQSALNAWLNSPEHKASIEGDFTHFGISIRVNSDGKKYYTNIFVKI